MANCNASANDCSVFLDGVTPQFDAVVVLGGNIRETSQRGFVTTSFAEGSEKSIGAHARTLAAAELYKKGLSKLFIVSTGRTIPLKEDPTMQDPTKPTESSVMKAEMIRYGVPEKQIIEENISKTTQENAREVAKIIREKGFRTIGLLTSLWHLERSMEFFKLQGLDKEGVTIAPLSSEDIIADKSPRHAALVQLVKNSPTMKEKLEKRTTGNRSY